MSSILSKHDKVTEIVKCGKNPVHFINTYVYIQHPVKGRIKFDTYPFQDDVVRDLQKNRFNIVLKSRQLGLSTICAAYAVWYGLFHKDKNILVIATKLDTAQNFIKKVKVALAALPPWLLITKWEENKTSVTFDNGSRIVAIPTSDDAGRSEAISLLIVDEAAFIKNFDTIWTGLSPTISTGGRAFILSTPNGVGGTYYKLWCDAEAGQNSFNPIKLPWFVHPEHDETWFKNETKNLSKRKIAQEFLCVGGDTKIITPFGYTLAKEIKVGDEVLTNKGRFKRVLRTHSRVLNESDSLFKFNSPGNRKNDVFITGNHPLLSYRFWANTVSSLNYLSNHPNTPLSWEPVSVCAQKRKTTDRITNVLFPKFDESLLTNELKTIDLSVYHESTSIGDTACRYENQCTKRFIDVDFNLGKFIGLYLAEGCNARGGIDLGFHIDELDTHVRWCFNFLSELNCRVSTGINSTTRGCRLWTHNKHIGGLCRAFVMGTLANNKTLNFELLLKTNKEFIKGLLFGHYLGDGNHNHDTKTRVYSTSSKLIYQLRTLYSMFGLYPRIGHDERLKKNKQHCDMWYLEFQAKNVQFIDLLNSGQQYKKQSRTRFINDHFIGHHTFTNVSELITQDGGFEVFDIQVDEDSSFVIESAVVHNCDFLASGQTFLNVDDLDWLKQCIKEPIEKSGYDNSVWIWAHPEPDKRYVISADVARGDGADFSAFHIIDVDDGFVAAEYLGKAPPEVMGQMIDEYGRKYNNALAAPENNTFGYTTVIYLRDAGYPTLYYEKHGGDPFNFTPEDSMLPGFSTQKKSRLNILTKLEELIRNRMIKCHSSRLAQQMQAFICDETGKAKAMKDSHDDLIISLAIGMFIVGGAVQQDNVRVQQTIAMLTSASKTARNAAILPGLGGTPELHPNSTSVTYNIHQKPQILSSENARGMRIRQQINPRWGWLLK